MTGPAEPGRVPPRNEELERRSRQAIERAIREAPDARAPRDSAAYRAAVAQDLLARGINPTEVATRLILETSFPGVGAAIVRNQADALGDQARATRERTREVQEREVREREAAERLRRATRDLDVGYGRERFERKR